MSVILPLAENVAKAISKWFSERYLFVNEEKLESVFYRHFLIENGGHLALQATTSLNFDSAIDSAIKLLCIFQPAALLRKEHHKCFISF